MAGKRVLANEHNILNETIFHLKSILLNIKRHAHNLAAPLPKARKPQALIEAPVIAVSESELWNKHDSPDNWILTAGKIENLRIAARALNGVEVSAGQIFSFWRYIGRPARFKGYVAGREIREGCVVPTIAGGLCQLSNALYDAALSADFEIIERHKHTRVIAGSLAEQDRDATVKWNYVDLRFRSAYLFRIEAVLTSQKLIIKFKGTPNSPAPQPAGHIQRPSRLNDCYSCGNFECFKHPDPSFITKPNPATAFVLYEKWDEFDQYIIKHSTDNDFFIAPAINSFINNANYKWSSFKTARKTADVSFIVLKNTFYHKLHAKHNIFKTSLKIEENLARAMAKKIPLQSTHLVISQSMLPYLWEMGVLGGRTFDVLMTRLPFEKLHERLNSAHQKYPESPTLNDFRTSPHLIDLENEALTKAHKIITPNQEIAEIFSNKSVKLNWIIPEQRPLINAKANKILYPASSLARKGAYEMRQLAIDLKLEIAVAGDAIEHTGFWDGIKVEKFDRSTLQDVSLVIYPTYIEHHPKILLHAIAAGIPIITTTACGLQPADNITIVSIGDYKLLKQKVEEQLYAFQTPS